MRMATAVEEKVMADLYPEENTETREVTEENVIATLNAEKRNGETKEKYYHDKSRIQNTKNAKGKMVR